MLKIPVTDTSAPVWNIEINGSDIGSEAGRFVSHVEYESVDGMADMAKVRLVNPDNLVSDSKLFQPGNEMTIYAGYATSVEPLGTVKIIRNVPNYPQDGEPTLNVDGYTMDSDMMENEPPESKKKKGKGGRRFMDMTYSDIVAERIKDYGFKPDIDPTEEAARMCIQKAGMNDYKFVKGIANIVGYIMWVDKVPSAFGPAEWTFHFKHPAGLTQDFENVYKYNYHNDTNLLSFRPELLIKGAKTKLVVKVKDRESGDVFDAEVEELNDAAPDMKSTAAIDEPVDGEYTTASDIVLAFGGFTFDVISNRRFSTKAEVTAWAQQWYRRMRDNFILSRGRVIGDNTLFARQTHSIEGIGTAYDGQYYFSKVKHIINSNDGYTCQFGARKVVP